MIDADKVTNALRVRNEPIRASHLHPFRRFVSTTYIDTRERLGTIRDMLDDLASTGHSGIAAGSTWGS